MNATGGRPHAGWFPGLLTAGLAAALGVAINVATDLKTDWWAWLCVVALTVASGILATAITARTSNTPSTSRSGTPALVNTHSSGGRHNTTTTTVHGGVHFNPKAIPLVITVSVVVLVAAGGGLWASGYFGKPAQQDASFPAAGSAPNPITAAVHAVAPLCGYPWVTAKRPDQIHLPVPGQIIAYGNWSDWAEVSDGATSPPGLVQLTIQGRDNAPVTLTDIRVRVLNRRAPLHGTSLTRECGDQGAIRWLEVDLDRDPVRAVAKDQFDAMPEDTPAWERKPIKFPYTVSITNPETFMIQAETEDCDCDWVADVFWSAQGKTGVLPVTNSGKPFRTTSTKNAQSCSILDTELACSN
ncbi:hypothetical protein SAMN05421837_103642 [Amycolatopsis pretoriensis]|uniref:Uncharacterized protein n=1 Tax=Amycolatopsis pretoriensis TaxID=218821 RepID=A0A1H5QPI6_9PSEU|nr:hypothetical protein [Amycolatopsis pretoriensis]SEF27117.1 hypothetical protein SAMN05421837_103642 [Amycolatopsis pretoriensis]